METVGKIEEFDPEKEDGHFMWNDWDTSLQPMESTKKPGKGHVLVGDSPSAYKLIRSLVSPRKLGDLVYKNLVDTMKKQYNMVQLLHTCQSSGALRSTATLTQY